MEKKKYISEIPSLMREWDWEANADLDPAKLTVGSNKKAWWKCYLCKHKWKTAIHKRAQKGTHCPNCHHGFFLKNRKSIEKVKPQAIKDWHPSKNGNLKPYMFASESRFKIWWLCSECGKEWQQTIRNYRGCVNCHKKHRLIQGNLQKNYPKVAKEWHPTKNGDLKPDMVMSGSKKKVWWKCDKCGYEWEAIISNRVRLRGCPACGKKQRYATKIMNILKDDKSLADVMPELAKEWHPIKNGTLTPKDVTRSQGKKVWWICPNGHSFQATVNSRASKKTNCPICYSGRQTSFAEQAFYFYIKEIYPDAVSRYKADFLGKMELDIYIPSFSLALEYDGCAWHKEIKRDREKRKYQLCQQHGIYLIRLKEKSEDYADIADECICVTDLYREDKLNRTIPQILLKLYCHKTLFGSTKLLIPSYDINVKRDRIKILNTYRTHYTKNSFGHLYPEIAKEWHPTKNGDLTPYMFKPHSNHKVWWLCPKCGYEYLSSIGSRLNGGCKKCGIEKSTQVKRIKVNMIDIKSNNVIKTFISISDASRKMKISSGDITAVCRGKRTKAGGYAWRYADEDKAEKYKKDKNQLEFDFEAE